MINFPKHISLVKIPSHTEEWYAHRDKYLGSSEMGTILGINKWETRARTWQVKSGQINHRISDNEPMYWGRMLEDKIASSWEYYDIETGEYLENAGKDNKVRQCYDTGGFLINDKHPWLSAATDRLILPKQKTFTSEKTEVASPLEIKTIDHYAHNVNETGLPPYYEAQIMQQMIVCESKYAEFAYLVGGQLLKVEPRIYHQGFADSILEETYDFWYNCVLPAKEIMQEIAAKPSLSPTLIKRLQKYEPDIETTNAYIDWLKQNYREEVEKAQAPAELMPHIIGYSKATKLIKSLERIADGHKAHIMKAHRDLGAGRIDFGNAGKSSFTKKHVISPSKEVAISEDEADGIIKSII
jgi:putative phage-type endonuclease